MGRLVGQRCLTSSDKYHLDWMRFLYVYSVLYRLLLQSKSVLVVMIILVYVYVIGISNQTSVNNTHSATTTNHNSYSSVLSTIQNTPLMLL